MPHPKITFLFKITDIKVEPGYTKYWQRETREPWNDRIILQYMDQTPPHPPQKPQAYRETGRQGGTDEEKYIINSLHILSPQDILIFVLLYAADR